MSRVASPCLAHGCSACCHDTEMPLTGEDAARLAALGHDRAAFARVLDDGTLALRTRDEPTAEGARPCYFLRDGRCSVYDDRPAGCRIYPFVLTPEHRVVRDEDCPWRREFASDGSERRRLLRVLTAVERERVSRKG